jgi:DHA3 family macrolide efflux protein-like MFS transporter
VLKLLISHENKNFLRLWIAQLISQFGDRIHQLALVGLMAERFPGSTIELAKLMSFTILPVFVIQPVAGVFVDRWDRRTTLFVCDLIRFVLVLLIPFAFFYKTSIWPIYVIVFLVFSFSRFYVPAKMSIIPDLVTQENLLMANSLVTTTGMIAFVVGCALGGLIIDNYGARMGFIIDAITFLVSGLILFSIRMPFKINRSRIFSTGKEMVRTLKTSLWKEFSEGLKYLFSQKEIRFIIAMIFILFSAVGSIYVVIIIFIQEAFQSVTRDLSVLAICLGAGLFLGVLLYGHFGKNMKWHNTIFLCLLAGGLMLMGFADCVHQYSNLKMAMLLSFLMGMVVGPIFIASNTMIQVVSNETMRGKIFSTLEIIIHLAFVVSMFLSAWLSKFVGRVWILLGVGILFSVIAIIGFIVTKLKGDLAFNTKPMA